MPALFDDGGNALFVFLGLSLCLGGAAAYGTGRALALTWRGLWQAFAYCLPLAAAVRFLHFALFGEALVSPRAFAMSFGVALGFAWLGFRLTRARQMQSLYGWIGESHDLDGKENQT